MPYAPVFNEELFATTMQHRLKGFLNMIDKNVDFLNDALTLGKDKYDGGERIQVDWKFNRHSTQTQLSTGFETIALGAAPLGTIGDDDVYFGLQPIIIDKRTMLKNSGPAKLMDIGQQRQEDVHTHFREVIQDQLLSGNQAKASDLNSFNGFDLATGFLEPDPVGSQTNVVHNTSKATYATARHFQNQRIDFAGSFSGTGLTGLQEMQNRLRALGSKNKMKGKRRGYMSISFATNLKRSTLAQERYVNQKEGALDPGTPVIQFGGETLYIVDTLPQAGAVTTADPWSVVFIDWEIAKLMVHPKANFTQEKWQWLPDQRVMVAYVELMGQLITKGFSTHAVGYDGEVW